MNTIPIISIANKYTSGTRLKKSPGNLARQNKTKLHSSDKIRKMANSKPVMSLMFAMALLIGCQKINAQSVPSDNFATVELFDVDKGSQVYHEDFVVSKSKEQVAKISESLVNDSKEALECNLFGDDWALGTAVLGAGVAVVAGVASAPVVAAVATIAAIATGIYEVCHLSKQIETLEQDINLNTKFTEIDANDKKNEIFLNHNWLPKLLYPILKSKTNSISEQDRIAQKAKDIYGSFVTENISVNLSNSSDGRRNIIIQDAKTDFNIFNGISNGSNLSVDSKDYPGVSLERYEIKTSEYAKVIKEFLENTGIKNAKYRGFSYTNLIPEMQIKLTNSEKTQFIKIIKALENNYADSKHNPKCSDDKEIFDINGDSYINADDLEILQNIINWSDKQESVQTENAASKDINGDNKVTEQDARIENAYIEATQQIYDNSRRMYEATSGLLFGNSASVH